MEDVGEAQRALPSGMPYRGVNLSSAEWGVSSDGSGSLPGTHGTHYVYPDPTYVSGYRSAQAFVAKGMTVFRLPFRWERLQPQRRSAFNSAEWARLKTTVDGLLALGASVLIDPHNYARYGTALVGSSSVPNADFADLWRRLAAEFKGKPKVLFGLMNEPYGLPTEQWVGSANAAIAAIRAEGAQNLILVPGNAWSGAHSWTQSWYGTPNGTALLSVTDPANNYAFEVHQYLDVNYGGTSSACVSATVGAEKMQGFTQWLKAHGKKGFLGEFGAGESATCLAALEGLLDHLDANTDVYLGWTYWAAGPWWGSNWYSVEPSGSTDKPQMDVLEAHLSSAAPPPPLPSCTDGVKNGTETGIDCGGACAPCPTACQSRTYEAEAMGHTTGAAVSGGWNLYANGFMSTSHTFGAGATTLTVVARGSIAGGVWPRMTVSVGGTVAGQVFVDSTSWKPFTFSVSPGAGSKEVRIAYDNDAMVSGQDRNLYVDKLTVSCPTAVTCAPKVYEAESMSPTTGGAEGTAWNLWSNGSLSAQHTFTSGSTVLQVIARGSVAGGVWPRMRLYVGSALIGTANVSSTGWVAYGFTFVASAGASAIRVEFDNDAIVNGQDRNLCVDKVNVGCPG